MFRQQELPTILNKATQMARAMVAEYGMSEKMGPMQYEGNHSMFGGYTTPKHISELNSL